MTALASHYNLDVNEHNYLQFKKPKPRRRILRDIAVDLLNFYFHESLTRSRWLKQRPLRCGCFVISKDNNGNDVRKDWQSKPVSVASFEDQLEQGRFDHTRFNINAPRCEWLDASVDVAPGFHVVGSDGTAVRVRMPTTLGSAFPLVPTLDREGHAFNSFQLLLLKRLLDLRERVTQNSENFMGLDWFQELRSLISDAVSLIDTTLHQLYHKAKYDPLDGWTFDENRLGSRFGRRLTDKLCWVYRITGKHLNAPIGTKAFLRVKALRNHLQHFDPPCFCYTLEDVASWLNSVRDVADLNWKIRKAIGSPLCEPLIELLLAPDVIFVPRDLSLPRIPQPDDVGYGSTIPLNDADEDVDCSD